MTTRRGTVLNILFLFVCLGIPTFTWVAYDRAIPQWFSSLPERGQYGDQFGALNALFSGLAFGGVTFTLYLTYRQLRLQHREYEAQTASLQAGQQQLAQQTRLLSEQVTDALPHMHRVSDAEDRLEFAELFLRKAHERVETAISMIDSPEKQARAERALKESDAAWRTHVDLCIGFEIEAGPAPSGSTTALAAAVSSQVRLTEERGRQLAEWADWLLTNYRL